MSNDAQLLKAPNHAASFAAFLTGGFFAQIAQILLLRELLVTLDGDELALGVMLAAWLLMVGLGALAFGRGGDQRAVAVRYALVLAVGVLSVPPALVLVRLARLVLDAPLGAPLGLIETIGLSCAATVIPAAMIGALFPLMVRLARARPATTYGGEALGALLGGLVFIFVLIDHASPVTIAALAGVPAAAAGGWLLAARRSQRMPRITLVLVALICAAEIVVGAKMDNVIERARWSEAMPRHELQETRESPYGRYTLLSGQGQFSLFLDGKLQLDAPDPHDPGALIHTALLQHPKPRTVLLIGGGPVGNARHALAHDPDRIDIVELDPAPLELLRSRAPESMLAALEDPSVHLHHTDPALFLSTTERTYDAIVIDVGDPTTLGLNRLYAQRFLGLTASRLAPDGVLAFSIGGQSGGLGPEALARNAIVYRTVRRLLPAALVSSGDHCMIFARWAAAAVTLDAEALATRLTERGVDAPSYKAYLHADPLPPDRVLVLNERLAAWPDDPPHRSALELLDAVEGAAEVPPIKIESGPIINSNAVPRAYWRTRLFETAKHEPGLLPIIRPLPAATRAGLAFTALIVLVLAMIMRLRKGGQDQDRKARLALWLAAGTFAFAVMAMQIAIVLWYQSRNGQVYVGLALLTAAFMAGTGFGALRSTRLRHPRRALVLIQVVTAAAALPALVVASVVSAGAVTALAMLGAAGLGAALGVHFAACARLFPGDAGSASRRLYGADLLGAALAALITAAVIVPSDGLIAALLIAATAAILAAIVVALGTSPRAATP
jgi:spermidine synthase